VVVRVSGRDPRLGGRCAPDAARPSPRDAGPVRSPSGPVAPTSRRVIGRRVTGGAITAGPACVVVASPGWLGPGPATQPSLSPTRASVDLSRSPRPRPWLLHPARRRPHSPPPPLLSQPERQPTERPPTHSPGPTPDRPTVAVEGAWVWGLAERRCIAGYKGRWGSGRAPSDAQSGASPHTHAPPHTTTPPAPWR
jgi:hypothetical protein